MTAAKWNHRPLPNIQPFSYMRLAKELENFGGWFLAGSTMNQPTEEEAGVTHEDFTLHALCDSYGDPRAIDALVTRFGVRPEQVAMTCGSSEANALACMALLKPGDQVLAETPGYQALQYLPQLYGAEWVPFPRREENGFLPDPDELRRMLTDRTQLVMLTNLHNPTMAHMRPELVRDLAAICAERGVWLLVDEVYLDHLKPGDGDQTALHLGPNVIVTSSLTKVYGVGILRTGWMFAPEDLITRVLELIDLTTVVLPGIAMNLGARMLKNMDRLRPRARYFHDRGLPIISAWVDSRDDVELLPAPGGITSSIRVSWLKDSGHLADWLAAERRVMVAPGSAFQMPQWLRVNIASEPEWLKQALAALGDGLDAYRKQFPELVK